MKPQELLGVFVRAAGLYFMLAAILALITILATLGHTPLTALLVPAVEFILGMLIVRGADIVVGFTYR